MSDNPTESSRMATVGPVGVSYAPPPTVSPEPATYEFDDSDPARPILRLRKWDTHPDHARSRIPPASVVTYVRVSEEQRRNRVFQADATVARIGTALWDARSTWRAAEAKMNSTTGFTWAEIAEGGAEHTFQIVLPVLTQATLVKCSSDHCRIRGGVFDVSQDRIGALRNQVEGMTVAVENARRMVAQLEAQLATARSEFSAAKKAVREPFLFSAGGLPVGSPASIPAPVRRDNLGGTSYFQRRK